MRTFHRAWELHLGDIGTRRGVNGKHREIFTDAIMAPEM